MSKWLRSNGDGTYSPEGIEANIGSMSDLPNPSRTVTENIADLKNRTTIVTITNATTDGNGMVNIGVSASSFVLSAYCGGHVLHPFLWSTSAGWRVQSFNGVGGIEKNTDIGTVTVLVMSGV